MAVKHKKYQQRLRDQDCCIIIPTYNNGKTITGVIEAVLEYTSNIIVVNDGSTDGTTEELKKFNNLKIIEFTENQGKGAALRKAFKNAEKLGFEYAITMDSDGQHYPDDILVFLEVLENYNNPQPLLLIGSRNMDQKSIPGKSAVGNKVSSFWFKMETGVHLTDTQCGYRLYPLKLVNKLLLTTSRFEFEIEVIVKASWAGARIQNIPVKVHYDKLERVTHFRPWKDTARIVALNAYFVFKRTFNLIGK